MGTTYEAASTTPPLQEGRSERPDLLNERIEAGRLHILIPRTAVSCPIRPLGGHGRGTVTHPACGPEMQITICRFRLGAPSLLRNSRRPSSSRNIDNVSSCDTGRPSIAPIPEVNRVDGSLLDRGGEH